VAHSHTPRNGCVRFVFGIAAASRNTRFRAARYGPTQAGLAPADRASFGWRLQSFDHLVGKREHLVRDFEAKRQGGREIDDEIELDGLPSVDQLVRAYQERQRHLDAERLGGLEIDHQFEAR